MKITAQPESYAACEAELRAIYPRHWEELNVAPDIELNPAYETYHTMEAADSLLLVTLRDGPKLAGYLLGFLFPELHYKHVLACYGDIFYVLPEYRNGTSGTKLFRAVEAELKRRGAGRWYVTSKLHRDSGPLLRRMGFQAVEMHYSKRL